MFQKIKIKSVAFELEIKELNSAVIVFRRLLLSACFSIKIWDVIFFRILHSDCISIYFENIKTIFILKMEKDRNVDRFGLSFVTGNIMSL